MWLYVLIFIRIIISANKVPLSLIEQFTIILAFMGIGLLNHSHFVFPIFYPGMLHFSQISTLMLGNFMIIVSLLSNHLLCPDISHIISHLRHHELFLEHLIHLLINLWILAIRFLFEQLLSFDFDLIHFLISIYMNLNDFICYAVL